MSSEPRIPLVEPGTRPELASIERAIVAECERITLLYRALLTRFTKGISSRLRLRLSGLHHARTSPLTASDLTAFGA